MKPEKIDTGEFKKLLSVRRLRQYEVALTLGISESQMSRMANGRDTISRELLDKLAVALDASPFDLVAREDR